MIDLARAALLEALLALDRDLADAREARDRIWRLLLPEQRAGYAQLRGHPLSVAQAGDRYPDALVFRSPGQGRLVAFLRLMWPTIEPGRPFVDSRPLAAICSVLEAVSEGRTRRVLISCPPGVGKSLAVSSAWSGPFEWGPLGRPAERYVLVSHSEKLSLENNVRARRILETDLYRRLWPAVALRGDQNQKGRFDNDRTGWRVATSIGGTLTGLRGTRLVVDDPHEISDADSPPRLAEATRVFSEVLPTRLSDPATSAMVMICQRVHARDCSAVAIEQGWDVVVMPMRYEANHPVRSSPHLFVDWRTTEGELLDPLRFPAEVLDPLESSMRATGGSFAVLSQHQLRPTGREGNLFKRSWLKVIDLAPPGLRYVRSWDLAASEGAGDWTVGALVGIDADRRLFVTDLRRFRGSPLDVRRAVLACAQSDPPGTEISIPTDPGQAGKDQVEDYRRLLAGWTVRFPRPRGSKVERASPLAAQAEAGALHLVRGPWTEQAVDELTQFPSGPHDDVPDALVDAFSHLVADAYGELNFAAPEAIPLEGSAGYGAYGGAGAAGWTYAGDGPPWLSGPDGLGNPG